MPPVTFSNRKVATDQGTNAVHYSSAMLNQGTIPKKGCNLFRGSFFGYFFGEAKK